MATTCHKNEFFPEWDWDRVQVWIPIRRSDDYSEEQIRMIARHRIVMLEKCNGHVSHGNVEKGTLVAAERIKEASKGKTTVLFYWNIQINYLFYKANESFDADRWAYHKPKNDGTADEGLYKFKDRYYWYDHRSPGMREWWIQTALEMANSPFVDGIFLDGICKGDLMYFEKGRGWTKKPEGDRDVVESARELRKRLLPTGKLLVGNALRASGGFEDGNYRHMEYLDGSYLERWDFVGGRIDEEKKTGCRRGEVIARSIDLMRRALSENKIILLNAVYDDDTTTDKKDNRTLLGESCAADDKLDAMKRALRFPLAVFLIVVEPGAFFSHHSGVDADPKKHEIVDNNLFHDLKRPLGEPLGPPVREGYVFARSFQCVSVSVNVDTTETKLDWKTIQR